MKMFVEAPEVLYWVYWLFK